MKRTILLILTFLLLVNCKNENKTTEKNEKKEYFRLIVNAVVEYDDEFQLLYLEEDQDNISMKNAIILKVLGSSSPQELTFRIEEEGIPTKFFLRFGNEQKNQKINILQTQVFYGDDSFVIEKDKFYQFFSPNRYVEYDTENAVAICKEVDGKYEPWFRSRDVLIDKLLYDFQ